MGVFYDKHCIFCDTCVSIIVKIKCIDFDNNDICNKFYFIKNNIYFTTMNLSQNTYVTNFDTYDGTLEFPANQ